MVTELSVDKNELTLGGFIGAVDSFAITSNKAWYIEVDSATDWLQVDVDSGTNNKTIVVRTTKELTATAAPATLTIRSADPGQPPVTVRVVRNVTATKVFIRLYERNDYVLFHNAVATPDSGLIVVGITGKGVLGNLAYDGLIVRLSATGEVVWAKQLGGSQVDDFMDIVATSDGNYVAVGESQSKNGDVIGNHGAQDVWAVKFDESGTIIWNKCFGGKLGDHIFGLGALPNGSFLMLCNTKSMEGDVPVSAPSSYYKTWITTVDAAGALQGGTIIEDSTRNVFFRNLAATNDSNFIVGGFRSAMYGVESVACLVKITPTGNILWEKRFDTGVLVPSTAPVVATEDGGYLMSYSQDGPQTQYYDARFIKTDAAGNKVWEKTYGGNDDEITHTMIVQPGGKGYFAVLQTDSYEGGVPGFRGDNDIWLANLDLAGNIKWSNPLGGSKFDIGYKIIRTADNRFVIVGGSQSDDGDIGGVNGIFAGLIYKFE